MHGVYLWTEKRCRTVCQTEGGAFPFHNATLRVVFLLAGYQVAEGYVVVLDEELHLQFLMLVVLQVDRQRVGLIADGRLLDLSHLVAVTCRSCLLACDGQPLGEVAKVGLQS